MLITATWCAPARPAPTILRELAPRWADAVAAVHISDPDDALLTALRVTSLPTWLLFRPSPERSGTTAPAPAAPEADGGAGLHGEDSVSGVIPEDLEIPGPEAAAWAPMIQRLQQEQWVETHRRTGALPKHLIDEEFGTSARGMHPSRD